MSDYFIKGNRFYFPEPPKKIFRFLKDQEFGPIRGMANESTPATARLFVNPQTSGSFTLNSAEQAYVQSINTPAAFQYLQAAAGGWVNQGAWPLIQLLSFEDNLFEGEAMGDWVKVFTYKRGEPLVHNIYREQLWWNIKQDGSFVPGKTYADQAKIILISLTGVLLVPSFRVVEV